MWSVSTGRRRGSPPCGISARTTSPACGVIGRSRPTMAATRLASGPAALTTAATGKRLASKQCHRGDAIGLPPDGDHLAVRSREDAAARVADRLHQATSHRGRINPGFPGEPGDRCLGFGDGQPRFEIGQDDPRRQHLRRITPRLESLHILPQCGGFGGVVKPDEVAVKVVPGGWGQPPGQATIVLHRRHAQIEVGTGQLSVRVHPARTTRLSCRSPAPRDRAG